MNDQEEERHLIPSFKGAGASGDEGEVAHIGTVQAQVKAWEVIQ